MTGLSAALFGQLTAPAMVVALSPVSIVAVLVLLLHNDRPRPASVAFLLGRLVALAAATAVFLQVPRLADRFAQPDPAVTAWLLGVFGAVCVGLGAWLWARRDDAGAQPRWEARIARLSWVGAAAIGAVFVLANPKMMAANGAAGVLIGATVAAGSRRRWPSASTRCWQVARSPRRSWRTCCSVPGSIRRWREQNCGSSAVATWSRRSC